MRLAGKRNWRSTPTRRSRPVSTNTRPCITRTGRAGTTWGPLGTPADALAVDPVAGVDIGFRDEVIARDELASPPSRFDPLTGRNGAQRTAVERPVLARHQLDGRLEQPRWARLISWQGAGFDVTRHRHPVRHAGTAIPHKVPGRAPASVWA
jgi:hypothetical protein